MAAFAQTVYVTPSGAGAMNGTSWANAYGGLQLQTAILNVPVGGQVWVAAGTYLPTYEMEVGDLRSYTFYINRNIKVYGGFPATGSPTMANRNPAVNVTILSGDLNRGGDPNADAYHVVYLDHLPNTALLDGFTITKGNADGPTNLKQLGAGIFNDGGGAGNGSHPSVINCTFINNYGRGGSFFNEARNGGKASPAITNCTFKDNNGYNSAGIYSVASAGGKSNPVITACTFTNNVATNIGGAILNYSLQSGSEVSPFISQCTFNNNKTTGNGTSGGAIASYVQTQGKSNSFIENCTFTNNVAAWSGGAIMNYSRPDAQDGGECSPTIRNCSFVGNIAQTHVGGAIFNSAGEVQGSGHGIVSPQIENCVFNGNKAVYGGAAYNYSYYGKCEASFRSCTFYNNSASNFGGTIGNNTDSGTLTTFIINSIFWGNSGTDKNISIQTVTGVILSNSLLDEASCPTNVICGPGNIYNQDPLFADAANGNLRLQPCSPAINVGANGFNTINIDLDGNPRTIGGTVDMGAYEAPMVLCIKTAASSNPACVNSTVVLSATGGTTYSWKGPNNFSSTSATPSVVATTANKGVYSVTGVSGTITGSATVSLNITTLQAGIVGAPCIGGTIQFTATGMTTYSWNRPTNNFSSTAQNPVIPSSTLNDAGVYFVSGRSGLCVVSTMVAVMLKGPGINPSFTFSPSPIAAGNTVVLNATSATGSYDWSGPNGALGNGKTVTINNFQAVNAGVYRLTLTSGGCTGYIEKTLSLNNSPRLASEEAQTLHVQVSAYPNPVTSILQVDVVLQEASGITLQMLTGEGRLVQHIERSDEVTNHNVQLDVSSLPEGMYLLQVHNGKQQVVKRIIKGQP